MPNKPVKRKPSETRKFSKTLFKPKPKIALKEDTKNPHIRTINTMFSNAKNITSKTEKLKFSASFFTRKERSLKKILNEIANQVPAEKIFRELEDFDIAEFKSLGAKAYSEKLAKEIKNLREAFNYAETLLRKLH